jgi:hypothetical protein
MGDTQMETRSAEVQSDAEETKIKIVTYPSKNLPQSYVNFIIHYWLKSLRQDNDYFKLINNDVYSMVYQAYVKKLLAKPDMKVRIAVLADNNDVIFGFSVFEATTLHYVYLQKQARSKTGIIKGLSKDLIPDNIQAITHITKRWMRIWNKKFKHVIFNPFLG